jgi:hypothetical protein
MKTREFMSVFDLDDEFAERLRFLRVHACRGLVQQEERRIGGERPCDLQTALEAIRKAHGQIVCILQEILFFQQDDRLFAHALFFLVVDAQRGRKHVLLGAHMLGGQNVVKNRHTLPETDVLEGPRDAELGDAIRRRLMVRTAEYFFAFDPP